MPKPGQTIKRTSEPCSPPTRATAVVIAKKLLTIKTGLKMVTTEQLKELVRQKYSEIALQDKDTNQSSCCGSGCCSDEVYNIMTDDYSQLEGYNADADLGLGCGVPTQFARIGKG